MSCFLTTSFQRTFHVAETHYLSWKNSPTLLSDPSEFLFITKLELNSISCKLLFLDRKCCLLTWDILTVSQVGYELFCYICSDQKRQLRVDDVFFGIFLAIIVRNFVDISWSSTSSYPFLASASPLRSGALQSILGDCGSAPAALRELTPCPQRTLSPPPSCCWCARLCWPRMMWQCHVSSSECRCYRLKGFSLLKRFPLSAGAAGRLLDQPVGDWLEHVGLPQYESKLLLNGFDDLHYMVSSSLLLRCVQIDLNALDVYFCHVFPHFSDLFFSCLSPLPPT